MVMYGDEFEEPCCKCTECKGKGWVYGEDDEEDCMSCHGSGHRVDQLSKTLKTVITALAQERVAHNDLETTNLGLRSLVAKFREGFVCCPHCSHMYKGEANTMPQFVCPECTGEFLDGLVDG